MARNVCYSLYGKYSSTKNNGSQSSWNQRNIQGFGKEAKFRWASCIAEPESDTTDTAFGTEQILYRRPRLVRGWYLGKEPLEHRKRSTPFRFSFQLKDRERAAEGKNDKLKALKKKKIIYPESMTVGICSLQSRPPVKHERKVVTGASNAGLKGKGKQVQTMRALNTGQGVPMLGENPKKEVPIPGDNRFEIDSKDKDDMKPRLKGKGSRQNERRPRSKSKSPVKGRKLRPPGTDYLSGKKEDSGQCDNETHLDKELQVYTRKIPKCCVECFTFKEDDYDIWSRTSSYSPR